MVALFAASSNPLSIARAHYDAFAFDKCVKVLERTPGSDLPAKDRAQIELYLGLCRFNLGQDVQAERHFVQSLTIQPDLDLPPLTSPKIEAVWGRVRRQLKLDVVAQPTPPSDARSTRDPPRDGGSTAGQTAKSDVTQPRDASADGGVATTPAVPQRSFVVPIVFASVGLAASAFGLIFGIQAREQQVAAMEARFQMERILAVERAQQNALLANIAWSVAAGCALVALITLVVDLTTSPAPAAATSTDSAWRD